MRPGHTADLRDLARTWQAVLGHLEIDLGSHHYETWLRGSRPLGEEDGCLVVEAPNSFNLEWMNEQLQFVTQRAIERVTHERQSVRFVGRQANDDLGDNVIRRPRGRVMGTLNGRFTFERYLEAEGNRVALRSCGSLAAGGAAITPVVVFGAPGMGKTHLLHAAAARAADAGEVVACLSAEEFTSRYQGALRQHAVEKFQSSLRGVSLLIVDDLQYLAGKKATQDELVHTIEAITNAGGAVAIGSERHPADLDLPERLASRLTAGIVVQVAPFRTEERRAFACNLARELKTALPDWAIDRIAHLDAASVRVIQGAIHAAVTLSNCGMLEPERLDGELKRIAVLETPPAASDADLLATIAAYFKTSVEEIASRSRKSELVTARAAAAAALRNRGRSLREIGSLINRDHSTVRDLADRGADVLEAEQGLKARLAG